ncbi:hypothetical protein QUB05_05600 [Microcoleus sp. F10-C6]|uniref:hypothetical protein n=1 Tax=unclassified Microcoleus TaxID=2642155 RepID=UPI002FD0F3C5
MSAESKVRNRLKRVNPPTRIAGQSEQKISEHNYFAVYDLEFTEPSEAELKAAAEKAAQAKKRNGKETLDTLTLTISGNDFAIALQASLLDAIRDLIRYELKKIKGGDSEEESGKQGVERAGHPEVKLWFFEKAADVTPGYTRLKGEISFDLMNFVDSSNLAKQGKSQLIKESDIKKLSAQIKTIFTEAFKWERGEKMVVYHDWERGYSLQILCPTEAEGVRIVKEVLKIQGHELRSQFLKLNLPIGTPKPTIPIPKDEEVLGKKRKHKRYRPKSTVYYSYATLHLPSYGQKIALA